MIGADGVEAEPRLPFRRPRAQSFDADDKHAVSPLDKQGGHGLNQHPRKLSGNAVLQTTPTRRRALASLQTIPFYPAQMGMIRGTDPLSNPEHIAMQL